jgi:hypothetical protein
MEQVNFSFSCHFLTHIVRKNVTPYKGTFFSVSEYQKINMKSYKMGPLTKGTVKKLVLRLCIRKFQGSYHDLEFCCPG